MSHQVEIVFLGPAIVSRSFQKTHMEPLFLAGCLGLGDDLVDARKKIGSTVFGSGLTLAISKDLNMGS